MLLNRIKSGAFRRATSTGSSYSEETNSYNVSGLVYDLNGNIERLNRRGFIESTSTIGDLDKLVYDYFPSTNRLRSLDEDTGGNTTYGFKDGSSATQEYYYDANGNMIRDLNKDITASSNQAGILYNHLNLPTEIKFSGNNNKKINYFYTADGIKQKKVVNDNGSLKTTEYAGNYIYEAGVLEFFNQPEGYVEKPGTLYEYVYQYKDHLGNIRLSYKDINGDGDIDVTTNINTNEIVDEKNYYPFGLEHKGYNNLNSGHNYEQFQGQEWTEDLGLNWHEWKYRISDPAIGRFISIDPLSEGYVYNGVYNFAENRVIDGNELEGLEWENFMTKFKDPKDLQIKRPSSNAQRQSYKVITANNTKTFKEVKSKFLKNPQNLLTNSKAEFNSPVDGNGNETDFQEGSFIKINIDGPSNNGYVKVENITDNENNVSASFVTMEGHIEKGEISFSIKLNEDGTMSFSIESKSEVDQGIARTFAESFSRSEQKESWKEVLDNFVELTGGEEKDRDVKVGN